MEANGIMRFSDKRDATEKDSKRIAERTKGGPKLPK